MTKPLSDLALEAHYNRVVEEGGERIIHEMHVPGYRAAVVQFAGETMLIIRAEPRPEGAMNVGIPRSEIHRYLLTNGQASAQALAKASEWLRDMGREVTIAEIYKLCGVLESMWSYFFNVMPDALRITEREQIGEVSLYVDGELRRTRPI